MSTYGGGGAFNPDGTSLDLNANGAAQVVPSTIASIEGDGTAPTTKPTNVTNWVEIDITNSQSTGTGTNWVQVLSFTSGQISAINSLFTLNSTTPFQNVLFFLSDGTVLASWLRSGTPTTASTWLVKIPAGISSSSTYTIYMGIGATSTNFYSSTGNTGAYPTLTSTYAQYDNGANVFPVYQSFSGSGTPTGFTENGGTYTYGTANKGLTIVGPSSGNGTLQYATTNDPTVYIFEVYAKFGSATDTGTEIMQYGSGSGGGGASSTEILIASSDFNVQNFNGSATNNVSSGVAADTNWHWHSIYRTSTPASYYSVDQASYVENSSDITATSAMYPNVVSYTNATNYWQVFLLRPVPPSGVMPTFVIYSEFGYSAVSGVDNYLTVISPTLTTTSTTNVNLLEVKFKPTLSGYVMINVGAIVSNNSLGGGVNVNLYNATTSATIDAGNTYTQEGLASNPTFTELSWNGQLTKNTTYTFNVYFYAVTSGTASAQVKCLSIKEVY